MGLDQNRDNWRLYRLPEKTRIYSKVDMERVISENGEEFLLEYHGVERIIKEVSKKTKVVELVTPDNGDIASIIFRWQERNLLSLEADRESNGVAHEQMFGLMGHISVLVKQNKFIFNNDRLEPMRFLRSHDFCVTPYFSPGHVSCLVKTPQRVLHIDASSSIHAGYAELHKFDNICWTFVEYQMFDLIGSCGYFSAIGMIIGLEPKESTFDVFWGLLRDVLALSPSMPKRAKNLIFVKTMVNIGLRKDVRGDRVIPFPIDDDTDFDTLCRDFLVLRMDAQSVDFSCDILFLSLMKQTRTGFDKIDRLGHVLRGFLKQSFTQGTFKIAKCIDCGITVSQWDHLISLAKASLFSADKFI